MSSLMTTSISSSSATGKQKEIPARFSTTQKQLRYLTADEYPKWDALVETSPQGSVFCRSWWIHAVSPNARVLGLFEGGKLIAGIPLHFERRLGIQLCCMAKPTPRWGVVMLLPEGRQSTVITREMEILKTFAPHLSKVGPFAQAFHPSLHNWLPFYWAKFRQTSRVTYILEGLQDPDGIWKGMKSNCRNHIRKAEKQKITVSVCEPEVLSRAVAKTFRRQGLKTPYPAESIRTLCRAAAENDAGQCFAARDKQGRVHASAFVAWDKKRTYTVIAGADPGLRDSEAHSLLYWRLAVLSAERSQAFDFAGSIIEPIERFLRSFGAKQETYNYITKFPRWMDACLTLAGRK